MSEPTFFEPVPISKRQMIGPSPATLKLMLTPRAPHAEYRGTDIATGHEYWQGVDPPLSFVIVASAKQIIVWHIGSDPDRE